MKLAWRCAAGRVAGVLCGCLAALGAVAEEGPRELADPIAETIAKGDIVVGVVPFVRAPQSFDPVKPLGTNDAWARIQSLAPIPDGSGRLVFNDLRGLLYVTDVDGSEPAAYLDLRREGLALHNHDFPNEAGLLGFAFHPDFGKPGEPGHGKFYTAYSAAPESLQEVISGANQESVIREWTIADPGATAFVGTGREVFRVSQFAPTHNIGTIAFNPAAEPGSDDYGLLYVCLGDGGGANDPQKNGQNPESVLGAILRIDPLGIEKGEYGIPEDNPYADGQGGAPEVWAWGLRHAQQFSWDTDGRMFINDIGQDQVEEVNLGVAGGNYGWPLREGMFATAQGSAGTRLGSVYPLPEEESGRFIYPVAQYDHSEGFAIGSGFVYRGEGIPELQGRYVFGDITLGRIFHMDADDLTPGQPTTISELRLSIDGEERELADIAGYTNTYHAGIPRVDLRMGMDAAGEIFLLTKGDGWIRKLVAAN